jgi:hypothetical protein
MKVCPGVLAVPDHEGYTLIHKVFQYAKDLELIEYMIEADPVACLVAEFGNDHLT